MADSKNGEVRKEAPSGIIAMAPGPHFLRSDTQVQGRTQSSPPALPSQTVPTQTVSSQSKSAGGKRKSKKRSTKKKRRARKSKKNKK
jgi:hypothetical protein